MATVRLRSRKTGKDLRDHTNAPKPTITGPVESQLMRDAIEAGEVDWQPTRPEVKSIRETFLVAAHRDAYILSVAMAINGPHDAMPPRSRYSLKDVRVACWYQLTHLARMARLREAQAAIHQAMSMLPDPESHDSYLPVGLTDE